MLWAWPRRKKFKEESLIMAVQDQSIRTIYIKTGIDKTAEYQLHTLSGKNEVKAHCSWLALAISRRIKTKYEDIFSEN